MLEDRLRKLWDSLQGKKPHMRDFLSEIRLEGIRGITGLRVFLDYPVSVIAGGNASGKSTVLFAAACAYRSPGAGSRDFAPSTLFPDYRPRQGARSDGPATAAIEYDYRTPQGAVSMRWSRRKGWTRGFLGRTGAEQPTRPVCLRTPADLGNPSEMRGAVRLSRQRAAPNETPLTAAQIDFAQRILPFSYREVAELSGGNDENLLFASRRDGTSYSELHMAAGERAILRLSKEVAQLKEALVLIDGVEAGLHPSVQRLLMLHLQQLALRNDLQVIVTSHSPVVLDSVPNNARIFLERDDTGAVRIHPPYRDIVQNALYGRSDDTLNLLCQGESAEGLLDGLLDVLQYEFGIRIGSVRAGRGNGASQFPGHAAAFRKFGLVENFVFVLDGDQRNSGLAAKIRNATGNQQTPVLFLPGRHGPEQWVWECLSARPEIFAEPFGVGPDDLKQRTAGLNAIYGGASDHPAQIVKTKLENLADDINQDAAGISRIVAKEEAKNPASDIQPLVKELTDSVLGWPGGLSSGVQSHSDISGLRLSADFAAAIV